MKKINSPKIIPILIKDYTDEWFNKLCLCQIRQFEQLIEKGKKDGQALRLSIIKQLKKTEITCLTKRSRIATNIAISIAQSLVELSTEKQLALLINRINKALRSLNCQQDVTITICAKDFESLELLNLPENIRLESSDTVNKGDFILTTSKGELHSNLQLTLKQITTNLVTKYGDNYTNVTGLQNS
jgi:flagellar biosynthesis/type III secretory pathway protein FliH